MNHLYEIEFQDICKKVKIEINSFDKKLSYSVIGTPLKTSNYMIIGNNWGGDTTVMSQNSMPLVNDILVDPKNPTYRGYFDFFMLIFKNDKLKVINFLNDTVYTNGNFIRTPNERKKYKEALNFGYNITRKYLKEIIKLVKPETIICFGNSNKSATSSVFKSLGIEEDFWKIDDIKIDKTSNNWATYHLVTTIENHEYEIFSFPHSSKLNLWKPDITFTKNYLKLSKVLVD